VVDFGLATVLTPDDPRPRYTRRVLELTVFLIPSVLYLLAQHVRVRRGRAGVDRLPAPARLGLTPGTGSGYLWALVLLIPLSILGYLALILIPPDALSTPGVSVAAVSSAGVAVNTALRALGEELFFRGLLGGIFVRRLGFYVGNTLQAVVFLVPHAALLLIDTRLWPILPVQFAAGWLLGWLRTKSGSILPGALVHAAANVAAGLLVG
jgi:membrane protease YdiL (CAAX protease family)